MAKKKSEAPPGPGWIVTFADLMALLMSFFVMLVAFSSQDKEKMHVVAGSMREAFGVEFEIRRDGSIEVPGVPVRKYLKQIGAVASKEQAAFAQYQHDQKEKQGPEANTHDINPTDVERARMFSTAAATLRQAWQEMPEIAAQSKNIIIEETKEGLAVQLMDQEGRSMFPEDSKHPYERTRILLTKLVPALRKLPNPIQIVGHTTAKRIKNNPNYTNWELSADRANAIREILIANGLPEERIHSVQGRAHTQPLFPNDPFLSANSRISIILIPEAPPIPIGLKP